MKLVKNLIVGLVGLVASSGALLAVPPTTVPDASSSIVMLGLGLIALAAFRARK